MKVLRMFTVRLEITIRYKRSSPRKFSLTKFRIETCLIFFFTEFETGVVTFSLHRLKVCVISLLIPDSGHMSNVQVYSKLTCTYLRNAFLVISYTSFAFMSSVTDRNVLEQN
jgi:hypothetical protein